MTHYFRITGYYPKEDISFIMDSNGMFEKLWQFSAFIVSKGCKVIEVSTDEKFLDINIGKVKEDKEHVMLRASCNGRHKEIIQELDGVNHHAVEIGDMRYIPTRNV